ncbi:unnamed protein product [Phytophthora lilii]|uniref:Unnamed protein product n=1 Tax=Phytophthora lilii TaxID=2077276 RepID=A0A9W7D9H8_9STRA|nr:unnamed protein product [Phytophthora lilii]
MLAEISDVPVKIKIISSQQPSDVLLTGNHQLATWEKWLEVSRITSYFLGSLLFLLGSIYFYPKYSVMWSGKAILYGSWGFVIGCLYFFAGANLDFIQTIRYNHGTQLRQVLRAFNALLNHMAASIFILGALYFLPSWYPKSPELGCWAFIIGCILFCVAAVVEVLFICFTHENPRASGFRFSNIFCLGAVAAFETFLGALCFIIGSWYYLPKYINLVDEGTYYMNKAITFYVLGSMCFIANSCALMPGVYRTINSAQKRCDGKSSHQ